MTLDFDKNEIYDIETGETVADIEDVTSEEIIKILGAKMVRTQKQLLEGRVRELKRKILHTHDAALRNIYREHIKFLESEGIKWRSN